MSTPRGFALVLEDLERHGWAWRTWSYRTADEDGQQHAHTALIGRRVETVDGRRLVVLAQWLDGKWANGLSRHPEDPVAVSIGSRALRPLVQHEQPAPRWQRPNLNAPRPGSKVPRWDEGGPVAERARINAKRIAGGFDPLPELEG